MKPQIKPFDNLVDIVLDSDIYQPMRVHFKQRTSFIISGKVNTYKEIDINGTEKTYIKNIILKYSRITGIINFTISKITSIKEETITFNGPMLNENAIVIRLELEAFSNKNNNYKHKLKNKIEIGSDSIIHMSLNKKIKNLDKKDDIFPDREKQDQIDICFNRVTGG